MTDKLASGTHGMQVVSGNPGDVAEDQLYVVTQIEGDDTQAHNMRALREAGHPLVVLHVKDPYEIGGLLFAWQMAVAVAAYHLQRMPLDASRQRAMA